MILPSRSPLRQPDSKESRSRGSASSEQSSFYFSFINLSAEASAYREAIASHARAQFARQHRVWLLQVVIFGRSARFIRWDRSGAVVSERFDYVSHPILLAGFFWRFAHLSDEQRGWDSTARLATRKECELLTDAVKEFVKNG